MAQNIECDQCGNVAIRRVGSNNLCLTCWEKFEAIRGAEINRQVGFANFALDHMDSIVGIPRSGPRLRIGTRIVKLEGMTLNNINVSNSVLGVLNTGSINSIDVSISKLKESGSKEVARALESLVTAITTSDELSNDQKNECVDLLSVVSTEATTPLKERKPVVARTLIAQAGEIIRTTHAGVALWDKFSQPIIDFFS